MQKLYLKDFLLLTNTKQCFSISYLHQQNGLIERAHRSVLKHLRALVLESRVSPTWSTFLPIIQRILNTTVHSITGTAPIHIITR
jgi:3-polyprenyl-4-hydroxybenzoate decarboxylase